MSEAKRVPLQTLEFPESLGHAAKKDKKGDKGKQFAPSFRFTLTLPESNEKTCPEFNYAQLLKAEEKKRRKEQKRGDENTTNGLDPFDDDDDENKLRDMARRFEAKYGTATLGKKKRKYDDYVDLGAGYDENDSFIDNTDAYDEIVPEEVTTAHGGFYINSGALEFKTSENHPLVNNNNNNNNDKNESSESSEEDTEGAESPKRSEKRMISSSDDEETEEASRENPAKKQRMDENSEKKANHENIMKKKKKQQNHQDLRQQEADILNRRKEKNEATDAEGGTGSEDLEEKKKTEKPEAARSKPSLEKKFDMKKFVKKSSSNGLDVKQIDSKKLDGKDNNIDDAIESVVNAARVDDESSRDTTDSGKSRGILGTESEGEEIDKEEAPLPEPLPEDIKELINTIKAHAETSKEGKYKFFTTAVNNALFSLEKKLSMLNQPSVRQQTYAHLSHFLPCSKVTLVNRVKKLCLQDAEYKVKEPLQRLKTIIDIVMPSVMEKHMKECQKVADEKGYEGSPADAESSDDEEGSPKNGEKSKIPRRRFPWTDETKKLVYDIANARRQYFKILRPRKESMESFVKAFLSTKVLPLWPPGYVRLETLLKYSNSEPAAKKKSKKPKETVSAINLATAGTAVGNSGMRFDVINTNNAAFQEREKTTTNLSKSSSVTEGFISQGMMKPNDPTGERMPQIVSKHKDKSKENPMTGHGHENFATIVNNSTVGKISVVPTAQLMAQKPIKNHIDKFNLMDLTNSSLSITPVNDYQKPTLKPPETKKDVVSITAYSESSNVHPNLSELSQSVHISGHRQEVTFSGGQLQHSNYSMSNQSSSHSKPLSLKHRLLQDTAETKSDKRIDEKDVDAINKTDKKEKKRERCVEGKHRTTQDPKKRRKEQKIMEQQIGPATSEIVPIPQPTPLSKEEQEQRQIEETVAATNFLSQIINDDVSPRSGTEKRKDGGLGIDDGMGNMMQPTDQEKDVQMVMRSLKELQELQEMKFSPSHSPVGGGIQKTIKSSTQYGSYQDEYQRLYVKKEDKLRSKDEAQW